MVEAVRVPTCPARSSAKTLELPMDWAFPQDLFPKCFFGDTGTRRAPESSSVASQSGSGQLSCPESHPAEGA
jgi:hypothetical protein